jgi:hypothetical protein
VELTIKAAIGGWSIVEVPISLAERPIGSHSKIRVLRDGVAILGAVLSLIREFKSEQSRVGQTLVCPSDERGQTD